jgi:hypothetical protein
MALKITSIAVDLAKESDGDWVDIAEWPGVRLKVRSINSKDYQNAREQRQMKLTRDFGRLPFSSEMQPHINKFAASFLLLGWEGIVDGNEKPIEYSSEKAMEMLTDPAMRSLVEQVIWAANRVGSKDAEFTVAATKNSEPPAATI